MRNKIFFLLIILISAASILVSCKSTPEPSAAASRPATDPAKNRADQSRQRAMDFESPAYFPSEWEELESRYQSAGSPAEYTAVADAFDELFKKTIPLYAQAREDEILAAREPLVNSGFAGVFPEYLKKADDLALDAKAKYEAEDYYGARESVAAALAEYETLGMGARVFLARQEIIDRGFTQYDAENFLRADEVAQSAIESFDAGKKAEAISNAEEALLRYNLVLANGWTAYATVRRNAAAAEREAAIAERANVASRNTFREAEMIFVRADESLAAQNFNIAGLSYVEAEAMFAIARKETEEKRQRAEEIIRIAEEKIEESSGAATEAERIIEGGSR